MSLNWPSGGAQEGKSLCVMLNGRLCLFKVSKSSVGDLTVSFEVRRLRYFSPSCISIHHCILHFILWVVNCDPSLFFFTVNLYAMNL